MSADEKTVKYAKLEWYREVLSLEPNSKLFLPLARLLAELGSEENNAELMNEAFNVLRRGLDIHPDFMEARLFLIELLNMCGCKAQCGAEVARLASLFLSYPDFWDAWREYSITENESSDFTVALGFMSAIMRNKSLSIVHVLEAGLNALKTSSAPIFSTDTLNLAKNMEESSFNKVKNFSQIERCIQNVVEQSSAKQEDKQVIDLQKNILETKDQLKEDPVGCDVLSGNEQSGISSEHDEASHEMETDFDSLSEVFPKSHIENYANFAEQQKVLQQKTKSTKETLAELIKDANITVEPMESSPFRTKSMADLLAEQGDYSGALDIYKELLKKGYGNKAELEERIADIKMLAPELDVEIDPSKLLAIDDFVDTSFGLMADTLSTSQAASVSAEIEYKQAEEVIDSIKDLNAEEQEQEIPDLFGMDKEKKITDQNNLDINHSLETMEASATDTEVVEPLLSFEKNTDAASMSGEADINCDIEPDLNNMQDNLKVDTALENDKPNDKPAEALPNSDVASLLTKLAERLEIRAK